MSDRAPRTDVLTPGQRRRNKAAVCSRDNAPELRLRHVLHATGMRYRLRAALRGKPDVVFPRARVAVFVDGCYWHGCPLHATRPKTNAEWWAARLDRNKARDKEVDAALAAAGWRVIRVWAHEVLSGKPSDLLGVVARVQSAVQILVRSRRGEW